MDISIVNVNYKKFIYIVNKAIVAKENDKSPEAIREVLHEMIDYAWNNFKTEETDMQGFESQDYKQHKESQLDFVHRTLSYFNRVSSGDYHVLNEILEYLEQWQNNHIQNTDKRF